MANEIKTIADTGLTLTYQVLSAVGVEKVAETSLPEIGVTGYYTADDAIIAQGDMLVVLVGGVVSGASEYRPRTDADSVDGYGRHDWR